MVDRVYHLLDTMAEAHCVRERGTNASQWFARVHHLLDTMAEAHCVRDKGTNANQWLIEFTTFWTVWLKPTVYETKGLMPANG